MRTIYVDKDIPKVLAVKALKKAWRGVAFSALSHAHDRTIPDPPLPGPRGVRVRNRLCGICASDVSLLFGDAEPTAAPLALPGNDRRYLGHEVVSEVTEIGPEVTRFAVGDRVIMDTCFEGPNCHSQEIDALCPTCAAGIPALCENQSLGRGCPGVGGGFGDGYTCHESEVAPAPAGLTDEQIVIAEPLSVGMRAALRRPPAPGEHVLVLGAGIIGLTTAACIKAISPDCHLSVVARHDHQAAAARRAGADEIILGEDVYEAAARITGAQLYKGLLGSRMLMGGFEVVHDCVGTGKSLTDCLRWARARGTVVLVGVKIAPVKADLTPVWYQEVNLLGTYGHGTETFEGNTISTYDLVFQMIADGRLATEGLMTHRFGLDQWKEAVTTSLDKHSGAIKVAIEY